MVTVGFNEIVHVKINASLPGHPVGAGHSTLQPVGPGRGRPGLSGTAKRGLQGGVEGVRGAPGQLWRAAREGRVCFSVQRCSSFRGDGIEVQVGRIREKF